MTTGTATPVTDADRNLATVLAHRAADLAAATRPIDRKTATAKLDGACQAAHALGYTGGGTEFAIRMIAQDYVRTNPRPAGGGAWNTARKAWDRDAPAAIAPQLAAIGPNRPTGTGLQCPHCHGWGLTGCTCAPEQDL